MNKKHFKPTLRLIVCVVLDCGFNSLVSYGSFSVGLICFFTFSYMLVIIVKFFSHIYFTG